MSCSTFANTNPTPRACDNNEDATSVLHDRNFRLYTSIEICPAPLRFTNRRCYNMRARSSRGENRDSGHLSKSLAWNAPFKTPSLRLTCERCAVVNIMMTCVSRFCLLDVPLYRCPFLFVKKICCYVFHIDRTIRY